jgi:hypothetical protein
MQNLLFVAYLTTSITLCDQVPTKTLPDEGVASGTPVQLKNRPFVVSRHDGYFMIEPYRDRE